MYKSERAFSRAVTTVLGQHNIYYQRIESATTGVGIPDLYVIHKKNHIWIELKNMPFDKLSSTRWVIPWRKGQQAWAQKYKKASDRYVVTVVALNNGYLFIPMTKHYKDNVVPFNDCIKYTKVSDIIECIQIEMVIHDCMRKFLEV
jgi:hypothetical protein